MREVRFKYSTSRYWASTCQTLAAWRGAMWSVEESFKYRDDNTLRQREMCVCLHMYVCSASQNQTAQQRWHWWNFHQRLVEIVFGGWSKGHDDSCNIRHLKPLLLSLADHECYRGKSRASKSEDLGWKLTLACPWPPLSFIFSFIQWNEGLYIVCHPNVKCHMRCIWNHLLNYEMKHRQRWGAGHC